VYEVGYSGAWLPPSAWSDGEAWDRLIDWMHNYCENFDLRLIVTPNLDPLSGPDGLRRIADKAERQNEHGQGPGRNWQVGDGPIVIVWPKEKTVQKWVRDVGGLARQSIILLEREIADTRFKNFRGWATAVGAFNAATGKKDEPLPGLCDLLDSILTAHENELHLSPSSAASAYPTSAHLLRQKFQALIADGYDEDFVVTYAIALGYPGPLHRLRQHYSAAAT